MKKILLILLAFTSFASFAQAEFPESIQLTNQTSTTATKVNVQESNGVVNTIAKSDLIDVLEYASAINLPVTGVAGKIYVTIDNNKMYRWNGTIYIEYFLQKEDITNKISAITGYSETLYPNEKATHDGLDAKLNISDLPSNLTLYATNVPSGVSTYTKWVSTLNDPDYNTTAVNITTGAISGTAQLISGLSSIGGVITGNPGIINVTTVGNIRRTAGTGTAKFYFELYKRTSAGVETLLGVSDFTLPVDFNTYSEFSATAVWNDGIFTETDRIVIKFYGSRIAGGGDPTFDFQFGGLTPVRTIVPVPFRVVAGEYELKANKQNSLAVDGTGVKYPTVDAINVVLPVSYSKIVYVNATSPTTATIFDLINPPVTNDNLLKTDVNNLYIGTDASTWVYKTSPAGYVTKTVTSQTSNFNIEGTSIDAGNSKTAAISRLGSISATSIKRIGGLATEYLKADGSTTVLTNPITGTGTTNFISKWTGTATQGNSTITDNGTTITTPSILEVANIISSKSITIDGELRSYQKNSNLYTTMLTDVITLKSGLKRSNTDFFVYLKTNTGSTVLESTFLNQPIQFQYLGAELGRFTSTGSFLVATSTNNGQGVIQANGNITASAAILSNQVVVKSQLDLKANIDSQTFTGVPSVPTATAGTNTTQIASTAFVLANVNANAVLLTGDQTLSGVKTIDRTNVNLSSFRMFNNSSTSIAIENNNSDGIFRQSVNSSTGTHNRLYNESSGVANSNKNSSTGKFNINLNDINTGIFNDDSNTGSGIFNKNTNSGTGVFNDSFNISTGFFDKRRNDSTGILNYYDSNAGSTGDLQQYLKAGVVTAKVNHLGEISAPKITMTGTIELKSYTVATLPTGVEGATAYVTDAIAPIYLGALTGGGTVKAPVFYDGTVWRSTINAIDTSDIVYKSGIQTITGLKIFTENVYATGFIKTGGTSSQFLKADGSIDESDVVKNIVKDATQSANITGTVSETILYSKLIPANTFKDGDFMNLFSRVSKAGVLGTLTQRVRTNTSNTLTASILIASNLMVTSNQVGNLYRYFTVSNGFLTGISSGTSSNDLINTNALAQFNVFDPAVDNYIFITGQLSSSADTMYHLGTKITN